MACRLNPSPPLPDMGLNLQSGGSTIIWFGLTWSLELYQQTNARLWRQGQNADTVVLHHIIAKNTIDERVMKALRDKDKTQTALIDAVKAKFIKLTYGVNLRSQSVPIRGKQNLSEVQIMNPYEELANAMCCRRSRITGCTMMKRKSPVLSVFSVPIGLVS